MMNLSGALVTIGGALVITTLLVMPTPSNLPYGLFGSLCGTGVVAIVVGFALAYNEVHNKKDKGQ